MYKLTTFEKIGDSYNLPDDIIDRISDIYMKDCFSYENTLKYYTKRTNFYNHNYYHQHRIKMYIVDSEFKHYLRSFFSYQNLLLTVGSHNISFYYMNNHNEDILYNILFNRSLDLYINNGIRTFIKYLKYNKN